MAIEGFDELKTLWELEGSQPKTGLFGKTILVVLIIITVVSSLNSIDILAFFSEQDIVFAGVVLNPDGSRYEGVKVSLSCLPGDRAETTDSQGEYSISARKRDLKDRRHTTIVFEDANSVKLSRKIDWRDCFVVYHELIFR
jgi:hypothetical protein